MTAKEMFEELGYECEDNRKRSTPILQNILYKEKDYTGNSWLEIVFEMSSQTVDMYMCTEYKDTNRITARRCSLSVDLLQAINKQVEELEWLTPTLKTDDITISGEQFLKNIQRINNAYPTVKEHINKINDAVKRAKGSDKE